MQARAAVRRSKRNAKDKVIRPKLAKRYNSHFPYEEPILLLRSDASPAASASSQEDIRSMLRIKYSNKK
jgi:hypothetical protein